MKRIQKLMTLALAAVLTMSCSALPASAIDYPDEQSLIDTNAVTRNAEYLRVKSGYSTEIYDTSAVSSNYQWLHSGDEMYVIRYYRDSLNYMWVYGRVSKGDLYGEYGWVILNSSRMSVVQS